MSRTFRRKNDAFYSSVNEERALFKEFGSENKSLKKKMALFRSDNDGGIFSAPKWVRQSRTKARRTNIKKSLLTKIVKGEEDDIIVPGFKKDSSDYF